MTDSSGVHVIMHRLFRDHVIVYERDEIILYLIWAQNNKKNLCLCKIRNETVIVVYPSCKFVTQEKGTYSLKDEPWQIVD